MCRYKSILLIVPCKCIWLVAEEEVEYSWLKIRVYVGDLNAYPFKTLYFGKLKAQIDNLPPCIHHPGSTVINP